MSCDTPEDRVRSVMMDANRLAEVTIFLGGGQKLREIAPLASMLKRRKLRAVLEIGTLKGGTLWLWCQLAQPDATIISIDLPGGPGGGGYSLKEAARFRADYRQPHQQLHCLRRDSRLAATRDLAARGLEGRPLDLLFIDGDHSYRAVKRDYELYSPLVRPGGLIVFHDILPTTIYPRMQVDRFWREIRRRHRYRELLDLGDERGWGQWGGIGILYTPAGPRRRKPSLTPRAGTSARA